MSDNIELWQSIEMASQKFDRGLLTEDDYDAALFGLVNTDIERRRNAAKRFHIRITNNTKGEYRYGTTEHFVDTEAEATTLWIEWSSQDIAQLSSVKVDNATVDGAILRPSRPGDPSVVTIFTVVDRSGES